MWVEAALAVVRSSGLENDPVFLAVFVILSYRRLFSATQSISIGSVVLTALVAAACSRLAPLVWPMVLAQTASLQETMSPPSRAAPVVPEPEAEPPSMSPTTPQPHAQQQQQHERADDASAATALMPQLAAALGSFWR